MAMRNPRRGLSLLETVIGLFLMLGAFTFLMAMYRQSTGYLVKAEREARATLLADNVLAELRGWASIWSNYSQPTWTSWSSVTRPGFSGLEVRVEKRSQVLNAPDQGIESAWPVSERIVMAKSVEHVRLQVWSTGRMLVETYATIVEPERVVHATNPVRIVVVGSPSIPPNGELTFRAGLYDEDDAEIEDVSFVWNVEPGTGNATLREVARDGRSAVMQNVYQLRGGVAVVTGGNCRMSAAARYRAQRFSGTSEEIALGGP
jgi:hypothetical protein